MKTLESKYDTKETIKPISDFERLVKKESNGMFTQGGYINTRIEWHVYTRWIYYHYNFLLRNV